MNFLQKGKKVRLIVVLILMTGFRDSITAQNPASVDPHLVGGPCEGCEAVFEYGHRNLTPVDTLPDFGSDGPQLKITGTIYQSDGVTPAAGVILYIYHTNQAGVYEAKPDSRGWARRHGYIRGWIQTGDDGRYSFYTLLPGHYPDRSAPAHIHPVILEIDGTYYWVSSYRFADDPYIDGTSDSSGAPRAGSSGILHLTERGDLLIGERDFILGRNIPGYPR